MAVAANLGSLRRYRRHDGADFLVTDTSVAKSGDTTGEPERRAPGSLLLIALLLVAAFVVILNETILSVALPTLSLRHI